MKEQLHDLFTQAIKQLKSDGIIDTEHDVRLMFEHTRQKQHGDFATNVAMTLAKAAKRNPREIAQLIIAALPKDDLVTKIDIAGPGFINITLAQNAHYGVLNSVFKQGDEYGFAEPNSKFKVLVEFVSANPTGPLHVGHGRGAAYGNTLARLLTAAGNTVESEYYVNDAGRQMDILATSVWLRYLQLFDAQLALPDNAYKGEYIIELAKHIRDEGDDAYVIDSKKLVSTRADLEQEAAMDATIALAKSTLTTDGYAVFFELALTSILTDIREDLSGFGVEFDTWFLERSLFADNKIELAIEKLKLSKHLYEQGGAWWFRSTEFGDDKDRVVVRENGAPTYFASDIAYHYDKIERGFDQCINIWGSDHHGYLLRVKAALQALGVDQEKLVVLFVQFAVLYRGGKKIKMSTRGGKFVTLRELRDEIGLDAARFFYVQRKSEQHMDFDLDLAKSQSNDNPVYYVQYAHARICSIFRQADERGLQIHEPQLANFALLSSEHEATLLTLLQRFPEVIESSAKHYEPHQITYYLRELANAFHSYYNSINFLDAESETRDAMLALITAVKQVLANGLKIIGVCAPDRM